MDDVDWIELNAEPIDAGRAVAFVSTPAAGGIDVFLGCTRAETGPDGRRLVALDYEAYTEMAMKQLRLLASEARARWPVVRLAILHRVGRVELAQPSVVIAVATPHRAESFDACRWLIDALKVDVPIWKREVWDDGSGSWVDPSSHQAREHVVPHLALGLPSATSAVERSRLDARQERACVRRSERPRRVKGRAPQAGRLSGAARIGSGSGGTFGRTRHTTCTARPCAALAVDHLAALLRGHRARKPILRARFTLLMRWG
jgi:molybdopterin synthase catalytic subunit